MVKRYTRKLCFLSIILVIAFGNEQKLCAVCTSTVMKKLNEAFAHNAVTNLFVEEVEKVYTTEAIDKNTIGYTQYYALNSLFDCSHEMIQKNKDILIHINANAYNQTSEKAFKFIKKLIDYCGQLKQGKVALDTADSYYIDLTKYRDDLKQYRKLALLDLLVYAPKEVSIQEKKVTNFEKYFKDTSFRQFFNDYQLSFEDSLINKSIGEFDEKSKKKAEFALEEFIKLDSNYHNKSRDEIAFAAFNYLDEFKKKATAYSFQLTKELEREPNKLQKIFQRSKKGTQEKIDVLKKYTNFANSLQDALFEAVFYERPPLAFATLIETANPAYRLILAETKALQRIYNKVSDYFVTLLKMLISYENS